MALSQAQIIERSKLLIENAEKNIEAGDFDEGLKLIQAVFKIAPANIYARALEERILNIKTELRISEEAKRIAEEKISEFKNNFIKEHNEGFVKKEIKIELPEFLKPAEEDFKNKINSSSKIFIDFIESLGKDDRRKYSDEIEKINNSVKSFLSVLANEINKNMKDIGQVKVANKSRDIYRSLKYMMFKMAIDVHDQKPILNMLQFGLDLDDNTVVELEKQATKNIYFDMLRNYYGSGDPSEEQLKQIESVREFLRISTEDHNDMLLSIKKDFINIKKTAKLLIIDSNEKEVANLMTIIKKFFPSFQIQSAISIEDGINIFMSFKPAIIFCAQDFGKKKMSGNDLLNRINKDGLEFKNRKDNFILMISNSEKFILDSYRHAGINNFVFQPLTETVIYEKISKAVSNN